jgi:hypothetical protein
MLSKNFKECEYLAGIDVAEGRYYSNIYYKKNRLCGLVVRVIGYRSRDPGLIPGATGFPQR